MKKLLPVDLNTCIKTECWKYTRMCVIQAQPDYERCPYSHITIIVENNRHGFIIWRLYSPAYTRLLFWYITLKTVYMNNRLSLIKFPILKTALLYLRVNLPYKQLKIHTSLILFPSRRYSGTGYRASSRPRSNEVPFEIGNRFCVSQQPISPQCRRWRFYIDLLF